MLRCWPPCIPLLRRYIKSDSLLSSILRGGCREVDMSKIFKQLDFKKFVFQNFRNDNMTKILFFSNNKFSTCKFYKFFGQSFFLDSAGKSVFEKVATSQNMSFCGLYYVRTRKILIPKIQRGIVSKCSRCCRWRKK